MVAVYWKTQPDSDSTRTLIAHHAKILANLRKNTPKIDKLLGDLPKSGWISKDRKKEQILKNLAVLIRVGIMAGLGLPTRTNLVGTKSLA